jgi:hypothetical protein
VCWFRGSEDARAAGAAGADIIADDEVINRIMKELAGLMRRWRFPA